MVSTTVGKSLVAVACLVLLHGAIPSQSEQGNAILQLTFQLRALSAAYSTYERRFSFLCFAGYIHDDLTNDWMAVHGSQTSQSSKRLANQVTTFRHRLACFSSIRFTTTTAAGTGTTPTPTSSPAPTPTPTPAPSGAYKDGTYTGSVADAIFGSVQVAAVIQGGQLSNVNILQYPSDSGHSRAVSNSSLPQLAQEAIQAQSANVNIVSGATQTSQAFQQSLAAALAQAKT